MSDTDEIISILLSLETFSQTNSVLEDNSNLWDTLLIGIIALFVCQVSINKVVCSSGDN